MSGTLNIGIRRYKPFTQGFGVVSWKKENYIVHGSIFYLYLPIIKSK